MSKTALVGPDDCNGCQMDARQGITRPHNHGCPHALRMGEYCNACVGLLIERERERAERRQQEKRQEKLMVIHGAFDHTPRCTTGGCHD